MAFTPFTENDQPTMANFNTKFIEAIKESVSGALAAGVKIATGSYTGTGTYGSDNPCKLTFDFVPKLVIVYGTFGTDASHASKSPVVMVPAFGTYTYHGGSSYTVSGTVTTDGTTLEYYHTSSAYGQGNISGYVYTYIAIG